jgi:hypothetical protein
MLNNNVRADVSSPIVVVPATGDRRLMSACSLLLSGIIVSAESASPFSSNGIVVAGCLPVAIVGYDLWLQCSILAVVADVAATSDWRLTLACLLLVAAIVAMDQSHPLLLCDYSSDEIVAADSLPVATVSCNLCLHRLIVVATIKFLGYCYDTTIESIEFYGQITAERIHRALCFE